MAEKRKRTLKTERKEEPEKKKVEFTVYAPGANYVFLAGEFNHWDTQSLPMKRGKDGAWKTEVKLPPGRYEYKLLADNAWVEDLPGVEAVPNPFGTRNFVASIN